MNTTTSESVYQNSEIYQGLKVNLKPAPFGKRFLAACVDYGIIGLISYIALLGFLVLGGIMFGGLFSLAGATGSGKGTAGIVTLFLLYLFLALFILGLLALYHVYFIYFEYKKGRTPGKKLFGLTVVTDDGSPRTMGKMIIRELFRYADGLIVPAVICMAVTDRRQRLGDLMAGTFVAYSKLQEKSKNFLYVEQNDFNYIYEIVQPEADIDPNFMEEYLLFASKNFLKSFTDYHMQDPYLQDLERRVRHYFKGPDHERLDGRSALLFFAEHCYQLDMKRRNQTKG